MFMIVSEFKLYDMLKARIGESEAEAFLGLLENKVANKFTDEKNSIVSEIDVRLSATKVELDSKISNVRGELITKITDVRSELSVKISNTKADLIKWMFIFWIGQVGVTFGFILLYLRK